MINIFLKCSNCLFENQGTFQLFAGLRTSRTKQLYLMGVMPTSYADSDTELLYISMDDFQASGEKRTPDCLKNADGHGQRTLVPSAADEHRGEDAGGVIITLDTIIEKR